MTGSWKRTDHRATDGRNHICATFRAQPFTVSENSEEKIDGIDYSDATFTVTVNVTDLAQAPTVTIRQVNPDTADGFVDDKAGTMTFINTYVAPVSALPLTGGDATARNLILAGGGILLLAGVAWLLARRRRV